MFALAFLTLAADPLPLSLDTISVERARMLDGKQVTVTMFVAKPIDQSPDCTIVGAVDLPDGIERGAHLNGHRYDLEGTRITVTGKLWVIDHPGAFVEGVLVPAWTEIRVEEGK
ncbi:hypothetical protein VT84_33240 [Gemmata sp. SH-PL17]|uniref:hypothetical protein n=1 Tax=Gemmata sp. SH-PL17 TaxID=1630693 RepID=UPI00078C6180|nr:hypothetical protein [Gemmata sp. SH-PL17]AMV29308.1 hypothetical protein VT84_33240 [Gemmata sp. SH-PL17]